MPGTYTLTEDEKQKYLEYLKRKELPNSQSNQNFDFINELVSSVLNRWKGSYDQNEVFELVSDKLFFEPFEYLIINNQPQAFSPYFKKALDSAKTVEEYYGTMLVEMGVNPILAKQYKNITLEMYIKLCLQFKIEANQTVIENLS